MIRTRLVSQEQVKSLNESWHSFYQQQQQEEVVTGQQQQQQQQPPVGQQQQQQQQQPPTDEDPFKDLSLDNLDDNTKAIIEKAKLSHATLSKGLKETQEKVGKIENVARQYQSTADRAISKLREHNLLDDGRPAATRQTPEEQQEEALAAAYVKSGMQEPVAKQLAKTMMVGFGVLRPNILNEVGTVFGPQIGKLNGLAADRYLDDASASPESQLALKFPGVRDGARQIIDTMIQNRQDISKSSVDVAVKMALGEAMMKGGNGDVTNLLTQMKTGQPPQQQQQQQQQPSLLSAFFGGHLGGAGNAPVTFGNGGTGAPVAKNEDTARAAGKLAEIMDRQIGKKK
jgi:hypothetical protein